MLLCTASGLDVLGLAARAGYMPRAVEVIGWNGERDKPSGASAVYVSGLVITIMCRSHSAAQLLLLRLRALAQRDIFLSYIGLGS